MTVKNALKNGMVRLSASGIDTPVFDAEILLAYAIGRGRAITKPVAEDGLLSIIDTLRVELLAHPELELTRNQINVYKRFITRRSKREPIAYIVGHKAFYGLDFAVNKNVLIPRPDTEILVDEALHEMAGCRMSGVSCNIVDLGTGSGCIAVALAVKSGAQNQSAKVFAVDVSSAALAIARKNARRHGVKDRIIFCRGNLLTPVFRAIKHQQVPKLIIVANLPYLSTSEWRQTAPEIYKWEPREALEGGKDGLQYYRAMFQQLKQYSARNSAGIVCLCEICPHQISSFRRFVRQYLPRARCRTVKDLSGQVRMGAVVISLSS